MNFVTYKIILNSLLIEQEFYRLKPGDGYKYVNVLNCSWFLLLAAYLLTCESVIFLTLGYVGIFKKHM